MALHAFVVSRYGCGADLSYHEWVQGSAEPSDATTFRRETVGLRPVSELGKQLLERVDDPIGRRYIGLGVLRHGNDGQTGRLR